MDKVETKIILDKIYQLEKYILNNDTIYLPLAEKEKIILELKNQIYLLKRIL